MTPSNSRTSRGSAAETEAPPDAEERYPDLSDRLRKMVLQLDAELAEMTPTYERVVKEYTEITDARARLLGPNGAGATPSPSRTRMQSSSGASRGRGGVNRQAQFVSVVTENPGLKVAEIAQKMGIDANYVYRVAPKAIAQEQVVRTEEGLFYPPGHEAAVAARADEIAASGR